MLLRRNDAGHSVLRGDCGDERGSAARAVFREHQVKLIFGVDKLTDLLLHEVVEERMKSVNGAVDADRRVRPLDLVDDGGDGGRD